MFQSDLLSLFHRSVSHVCILDTPQVNTSAFYEQVLESLRAPENYNRKLLVDRLPGNALGRVQRVHKPADLRDITFCTR